MFWKMNGDISYDIGLAHFSTLAPSFSSHEFKKKHSVQFFSLYHTNHHHTVRKKENTIFVDFLNLFTI